MRVLFVTDHLSSTNGASSLSKAHLKILRNLVGEENFFLVSLYTGTKKYEDENFYEAYRTKIDKFKNIISLNHVDMNDDIIDMCISLIQNEKIEVVFSDESYFGKLVRKIKHQTDAVVMSFYHDVKAFLYKEWIKSERKRRIPEFVIGMLNEKWTAKFSDYNITLNDRESENFFRAYKKKADFSIPIILESNTILKENERMGEKIKLGFLGVYYYPNVNGIRWFCKNVMPNLCDDAELIIAGKGMEILKDELEQISDNIKVIGTVDSLLSFYSSVDIIVAPIFEGAGMKVKTAEAFSYGKPVVGTKESMVGYWDNILKDRLDELVCICTDAREFISHIKEFNKKLDKSNYEIIRKHFERYYSYQAASEVLNPYLNEIAKEKGEK